MQFAACIGGHAQKQSGGLQFKASIETVSLSEWLTGRSDILSLRQRVRDAAA